MKTSRARRLFSEILQAHASLILSNDDSKRLYDEDELKTKYLKLTS